MAAAGPFVPQLYRLTETRRELPDTVSLELAPLAGAPPAYEPGQFNMLYVFGVGEAAVSVSGSAEGGFVHTVRDVGAVTGALAGLKAGATVGLRGPFGRGWPVAEAQGEDVVVVAGGLGLAPLRPAIRAILERRERYGRVVVLFGTRNPEDMLYRHELEHWREHLDVEVEVTVDHADAGWHGNVGVVPALIPRASFDPENTVALVCGPEVMMRFTVNALRDAGLPSERIYISMERNMKCAVGLCGRCQFGPTFVCRDGPVMRFDRIAGIFAVREI